MSLRSALSWPSIGRAQKGQAVLEITASLIIFVIMLSIIMSISLYLYVQHAAVSTVREGARFASLNTDIGNPATEGVGISAVQAYVQNTATQLAGLTLNAEDVVVTPPDPAGIQGERNVQVEMTFNVTNPIGISGFLSAFGVEGNSFEEFPIHAEAIMRYEE